MTRLTRVVALLALVVSACSPTVSGPMPPRPAQPTGVPVTTVTTMSTTAVSAEALASVPACPTSFCVDYHIREGASWSDGSPVTGEDFAHTAELHETATTDVLSSPYAAVSAVEVIDETIVRVVFARPYGGWQNLFARVFRAGETATSIEQMDTTGPFVFEEWAEGEYLTLERDGDWWADGDPLSGGPPGDVQRIRFVFIESPEEMVDALEDGEVDVITARPDAGMMDRLRDLDEVDYLLAPGPFWEHIDFHHDDPLLSQGWARQAVSLAIDREKILDRTVRLVDADAVALDNTVWMRTSPYYEAHFDEGFDPERAEQILVDNGCRRGEDGVHVCGEIRMSFVWASTNDDPARREIFESAREDLEAVGVEIVADFRSPSSFVTRDFLFGGPDVWQLINFSWRARTDPISANPTYYCDDAGDLNVNRYCSDDVERLVRSTETTPHPDGRAALYNRADRLYLEDRALIPLYQKRTLMAWTSAIEGPRPNPSFSGDLWNIASWTGKAEVVVALPSEPDVIDPLSRADDSANVILGALLYGAHGMAPTHERVPVLVDSVEMITADDR